MILTRLVTEDPIPFSENLFSKENFNSVACPPTGRTKD